MFSIILPTYNRAHHLSVAIKSVLEQTISDWELIVVDDGSTDNTEDVVLNFNDVRIKYIYQDNSERSAARNKGIELAKGEWLCFLDSDDYYLNNHLESFSLFLEKENPAPSFLITGGYEERNGELIKKPLYDPSAGEHPALYILRQTIITPISVCIHRECFDQHRFAEVFKKSYWEDTHLWIRLAMSYPFYQLSSFTNVLAEHPGRSVNSKISMKRVKDHLSMIQHLYENYSLLLSPVISKYDIRVYMDRKYRMFLYQTRQNGQCLVALNIWLKAMFHKPSWYLVTELPKIFLNQLKIGIHER
jgi:glycosyltransferase involved in cell wall biosynthesis